MGQILTSNFASWRKFTNLMQLVVISQTRPNWFKLQHSDWSDVKPDMSLVLDYKAGRCTDGQYKQQYLAQLRHRHAAIKEMVLWMQSQPMPIVLLCHCGKGKFCHRRILAEYIKENFNIEIEEL